MLILGRGDVRSLLAGREHEIVGLVERAYRTHAEGGTSLPHSVFLRFPGSSRDRIIGLPAYIGDPVPMAGIKWIASFPGNLGSGLERASACIVLNSAADGRPEAFIEGSLISAARTAASAALAARLFSAEEAPTGVTLIGCGVINYEILRYLRAGFPGLDRALVYDLDPARAERFAQRAATELRVDATVAGTPAVALSGHSLVSLATTAAAPHLDLAPLPAASTVLHVSLRDIAVADILAAQNVVDDIDHVCRENTSVHLAAKKAGDRRFIDAEIGAVIRLPGTFHRDIAKTLIFSPFGLGVLDLALATWLVGQARARAIGSSFPGFLD
jgi:2,3-diaminopropionate biosynthesis protein SbnB